MFEFLEPPADAEPAALLDGVRSSVRAETKAAAQRLSYIWQLYRVRLRQYGERAEGAVGTVDAVAAEVAAALAIGLRPAAGYLDLAKAMFERLPLVGMVLSAGDIDIKTFETMVYRTDLIVDLDILADVDRELASRSPRWTAMSHKALGRAIDRVVAKADRDAVRRRRERVHDRGVEITEIGDGLASVWAIVTTTNALALKQRLNALIATVCENDPRTAQQLRADALGAMDADRLGCRCGADDCPAGGKTASNVVLHVIADQSTVAGASNTPGHVVGADQSIPAEMISELAEMARVRPLVNMADAPPEERYVPSKALADFVRYRDLTCRGPGCDVPASECDIDHVVPYLQGGITHASNLSCKCRTHHIYKTFGGWRDQQLPDGTLIWTLPDGQTCVTLPGSALLFPTLCQPSSPAPAPKVPADDRCTDRSALMPKRRRTRAQRRARRVAVERAQNRNAREARRKQREDYCAEMFASHDGDGDLPPF